MLPSHQSGSSANAFPSAPSQHEAAPRWRAWVVACLSLCCFVHCVGTALLAPLLPAALAFLGENEQYEWMLWSLSAVCATLSLWMHCPQVTSWLVSIWGAAVVSGIVSLVYGPEFARQLSLAGLVGVQFSMLHRKWRLHQETCTTSDTGTACCVRED